jgi:hypothetical protein
MSGQSTGCTTKNRVLNATMKSLLVCATGAFPILSQALPVIPNASGYGIETPAGRGGKVYKVTNLNNSGEGSLKACVDASGPRVCVFEVSGTIHMTDDLHVRNPKITIAGQTAPSPGILLRGGALFIKTSDVLVQHIRVRAGDDKVGADPDNRDALKIDAGGLSAPVNNVVIDHCSFSWAIDEIASVYANWNNVSLLNNIFAEPLHESLHSKGTHGYGIIFGPENNAKISFVGNLMAHNVARNPLTTASHAVIANNVIYNWGGSAVDLQSQKGFPTYNAVVGNVFIRGKDYEANKPVIIRADSARRVPSGSKVYVADNVAQEATSDPWSIVGTLGGSLDLSGYKASDTPVWPAGLTRMPTSNNGVLNSVLARAGARPADRDSVDKRIVQQVKDRTGGFINCVAADGSARCAKNAGGWPNMPMNRRTLKLPDDPNGKTSSGYTNLEVWLHKMAAEVEGRAEAPPKPPVLRVSE